MLDPKIIRANPDAIRQSLKNRCSDEAVLDAFLEADELRRKVLAESESLKALRNTVSEEISRMKRAGQDASTEIARMREVSDRIKELDAQVRDFEERVEGAAMVIPNPPDESVPIGQDDSDNRIIREWGDPPKFDFAPLPHWDIAVKLGMVDFERG